MVVYLDLLFLLNFVIDGALLLVTARTCRIAIRWGRLAAASAIGAGYVVMMLFPALSFLYTFAVKFAFALLMIAAAYGYGTLTRYARTLGVFYLVNFSAAGGILGFHYLLRSSGDVMNGIYYSRSGGFSFPVKMGLWSVLALFPAAIWLYLRVFRAAQERSGLVSHIADVEIRVDDFTLVCRGLVDTGNRLYDPLTKTPVMVVEAAGWKQVLPAGWMENIRRCEVDRMIAGLGEAEFVWQDRLRLVPYRGVNRGTQFMLAIKPDSVIVRLPDRQVESSRVLVGFDGGTLSAEGDYQAIIHPALLSG